MLGETNIDNSPFLVMDGPNAQLCWRLPVGDAVKVNFDGASCASTHLASLEVLFQDNMGSFLHAKSYGIEAANALSTKCLAAQLVLSTNFELRFNRVLLEDDSLEVITFLSDPTTVNPSWGISDIIHDCITLINSFEQVFFLCSC